LAALWEPDLRRPLTVLAVGIGVLTGLLVLRRGSRLGDRAFLGVMLGFVAFTIWQEGQISDVVSLTALEFPLLGPIMMVGVFAGSRWHLAALVGLTMIGGGWLASLNMAAADVPGEVIPDSFMFIIGAVVVRVLRDVAHDSLEMAHGALARAERGEVTDPLTGLCNRRGLERFGGSVWRDQARAGRPVTLLVLDIDHFKRVNDSLGHAAGDDLLRGVARLVSGVTRSDDVLVRLGGEEFLVLVPGGTSETLGLAERLRALVEEQLRPVTVSIGVHETTPRVADELPAAIWGAAEVADRAMYAAKQCGRNQVIVAPAAGGPGAAGVTGGHRAGQRT
jgi:diguanylate cyclase (GGDEF)-like protein